jgi:uncharacterized membrane-anchored protein
MKLSTRHHSPVNAGAAGTVRADRRLETVLRKAGAGDIAVIDHSDLDSNDADALLDRGVAAVVNASPFISGRYPNLGPELLAKAGVLLVDDAGPEVLKAVKDGSPARVADDGTVYVGDRAVATGRPLGLDDVRTQMDAAREGLTAQLQSLTHNATEYLRREQDLFLHGLGVPHLATAMQGRPAVVVVSDFDHEADLRRIRAFIREQKPVLVGVDAGAEALRAAGLRPDVVVVGPAGLGGANGASRAVSDQALTAAREVVVHADASDRAEGSERLDRLGIRSQRIAASGATEDIALLVADHQGASLIVTVGTHATLEELLDRQRNGLASTFLTRLRVGPRLVDARSVPTLYSGRVRTWQLLLVLLVGLLAVAGAVALTPQGEQWIDELRSALTALPGRLEGLLS